MHGVYRFAELNASVKNLISHRARSIEMVKAYFVTLDAQKSTPPSLSTPPPPSLNAHECTLYIATRQIQTNLTEREWTVGFLV
jgi:hypothetical protein